MARIGNGKKTFRLAPPETATNVGQQLAETLRAQEKVPEFARFGIVEIDCRYIPSSSYAVTIQIQTTRRIANRGQLSGWLSHFGLKPTAVYKDAQQVYCADVPFENRRARIEFYRVL